MSEDIGHQIRNALRLLTISVVLLFVLLGGAGLAAYLDSVHRREDLEQIATSTNAALCTLRSDLERRVKDSRDFLEENPDGIPGISPETIAQSIENQQQTIDALGGLDCSAKALTRSSPTAAVAAFQYVLNVSNRTADAKIRVLEERVRQVEKVNRMLVSTIQDEGITPPPDVPPLPTIIPPVIDDPLPPDPAPTVIPSPSPSATCLPVIGCVP
jgi:hypothetical protein